MRCPKYTRKPTRILSAPKTKNVDAPPDPLTRQDADALAPRNSPLAPPYAINTSSICPIAQSRSSRLMTRGGAKRMVLTWVSLHRMPRSRRASQ